MKQMTLFGEQSRLDYIIISIQEPYFNRILEGKKKFEYRRKFYDHPVFAFVYVPAPVKRISGLLKLGKPIYDSVDAIARIAE